VCCWRSHWKTSNYIRSTTPTVPSSRLLSCNTPRLACTAEETCAANPVCRVCRVEAAHGIEHVAGRAATTTVPQPQQTTQHDWPEPMWPTHGLVSTSQRSDTPMPYPSTIIHQDRALALVRALAAMLTTVLQRTPHTARHNRQACRRDTTTPLVAQHTAPCTSSAAMLHLPGH
jgi:hypothetical protein